MPDLPEELHPHSGVERLWVGSDLMCALKLQT